MGKILRLADLCPKNEKPRCLEDYLRLVKAWRPDLDRILNESIIRARPDELKKIFSAILMNYLAQEKMIDSDYFNCAEYIADFLADYHNKCNFSWYAIDYLIKGQEDSIQLREGANICFLICSVFPERGNFREMTIGDYEKMGRSLYYQYGEKLHHDIGYLMGRHFKTMSAVTYDGLQKFKEQHN